MYFDGNYDPYKAAYSSMPSHAAANPDIKQLYIDGHFCYYYKFGIVTNGLGIVRHIDFYNKDFFEKHPEIILEKKSDSPDEDKSVHDSVNENGIPLPGKRFTCLSWHCDLILAGITQLIGVFLADKVEQHQYIRSLKPLIT